ncbi:MAG: carotenoid biosynthesis protein [Gemmatimonadaceae bacterium]|nr:carotenoid biosynthesis protein [Gemmatimonadaceae bacterium]
MRLTATAYPLDRASRGLFIGHLILIAFATAAMVTILAGEFPVWMQGPYTQTVYRLGWKYSGQIYILLGALAVLLHSAPRFGTGRALAVFGVASCVALASELGGTNIGFPFGPYHYTEMLGYRILGDVPYPIPISWYYMLYGSLAICARLMASDDSSASRWRWALVAGAVLTAWDVPMEVHMTNVNPPHWVWDLDKVPAWVPAWLVTPVFYGMPISNWIGWYVTGVVVSRLMLWLVPPSTWARTVAPVSFPFAIYAANGVMPIAVSARHGYWGALIGGVLCMGLPLWLAWRAGREPAPRLETAGLAA